MMRATSPCPRRVLERGDTATVPDSRIRTRGQEDRHDLLVALRTVAEDHRLQQGGPTKIVYVVDIDTGAHHAPHVVDVASLARRDERRAAESVAECQIRPGRQQHLEHVDTAGHPGDQPRRVVLLIQRIRVCP